MKINPNLSFLAEQFNKNINGVCLEGSSRCFFKEQLIFTEKGNIKISELKIGDSVLTFNHKKNIQEYKQVVNCVKQTNKKKCFKIKLKDGTIIQCTEDHKFYFNKRYIEVKNILSLLKK